jgi:hypothetical protein
VASSINNDVVKVGRIMIVLSLPVALSYPPSCIIVSQSSISTGRGCFFTSGTLCLISRLITNGRLTPKVSDQQRCCNDLTHRFSPLLG